MIFSILKSMGLKNYSVHGQDVDHLLTVIHYFMFILFIGWTCFFFFCLWRFWHRRNPKASYKGMTSHFSTHIEIGVILVELILLIGFAFPMWKERVDTFDRTMKENPVRVRVIGWQFAWMYHYPGKDGIFGHTNPRKVNSSNPLGLDKKDVNGKDDFISFILKIPVKKPVILQITSKDVIHNFSIVPMRIQQDAIPGKEIPMWFTPIEKMETYVVCGQLCGEGHANMVGAMEVIGEKSFISWYNQQSLLSLESATN